MTRRRIIVPDLRIGNLASVANMVRKCGGTAEVVTDPEEVTDDCKVILAGVGSFDAAMATVSENGWTERLDDLAERGEAPILGICLGMQLMCKSSEEGSQAGLGWMDAEVKRFLLPPGSGLKSPHMGWNTVKVVKPNGFIPGEGEQRFYFVHSYYVSCRRQEDVVATATHGTEFAAAFGRDNLFGVQFHPEKSHRFGMALIRKFVEL